MYIDGFKKTKNDFQEELKKRFPYDEVEVLEYEKASGPITYKCLKCGEVYNKTRANHLYEKKTLCNKCYTGRTSKIRQAFLDRANEGLFEILDNPNKSLREHFHIKCTKCGKEYDYRPQQSLLKSWSCRFCGKNGAPVIEEEYKKRMGTFIADFEILEYKNITKSVLFKHKCGYIFSRLGTNFSNQPTCPKCNPKRSNGEQIIYDWLVTHHIDFEEQKKFGDLGQLSYDFYIPSKRLLIEYQGIQHYEPQDCFGGEERFKVQQEHDKKKREYATKNHYTLLEISYREHNNIRNILESSTTIP